MKYLSIIVSIFLCYSCSNDYKKYRDVNSFRIYELQCDGKFYMTIEDCSCEKLPENYFIPKGHSNDNFYEFYARENNNRLEIYTLYDEFEVHGTFKNQIDFFMSKDNSTFMDFIHQNNLKVFRGYSNGQNHP